MSEFQPGDKAVVFRPGRHMSTPHIGYVTVDRVLKRDIVCSDGSRFNKNTCERHDGGTWGWVTYLVRPDDPRIEAARAVIRHHTARSKAHLAFDKWRRKEAAAADVAAAFTALSEIEEKS